jgi:ABC-type uncharacterized transport system fused permease/ATPase subunit
MGSQLFGLRDRILDIVESAIREALSPVIPYLRKLVAGALVVALSIFAFSLTLFSAAGALFFAFAGLPYVIAALWTAAIFFVIGLAFFGTGMAMLRKPRRSY